MTPFSGLRAALLATALTGLGGAAFAAGTTPGTNVVNSIDLSYESGGSTITRTGVASADFLVDRKIDFSMEGQNLGKRIDVEQGSEDAVLTYRLINEGNDSSGYDIDVVLSDEGAPIDGSGLSYDATGSGGAGTYSVYLSSDATFDAGDTLYDLTAGGGISSIGDLVADGEIYILIVGDIPETAEDDELDIFTVTATALDTGTDTVTLEDTGNGEDAVDTVFADPGQDGQENDAQKIAIQAPVISATKTSTVISENLDGTFDCAVDPADPAAESFVPGACLAYTISVVNDGSASIAASNVSVIDALPDDVTFVAISSYSGFDSVTESAGTITATAASLGIGDTASFTVRATIN